MKKKAIERIPYLTLKNTIRSKDIKYVAVTAFRNISHERHLFVEVYENKKACSKVPVIRIVLTKKDFGNYYPYKGIWTAEKIKDSVYYSTLLWEDRGPSNWEEIKNRIKRNVLQSESDERRIKNFCMKDTDKWFDIIEKFETNITTSLRIRAEKLKKERRQRGLDERAKLTPELDLKDIALRVDRDYFKIKHYIYYKKKGDFATLGCSACGKIVKGIWRSSMSYESNFQYHVPEPIKGQVGCCPECGSYGIYKPQGTAKAFYSNTINAYTASPYKNNGLIVRYIEARKDWQMELDDRGKGEEIVGASEHIYVAEVARAYIEPGKITQIDYCKYDYWTKKDFWDDCNYGMYEGRAIRIKEAEILPEAYEALDNSAFKYCQIKEYEHIYGKINMIDYIQMYKKYPQMEFLMKLGFYPVVKRIVGYGCGFFYNQRSKRLHEFLGIRKEYVEMLMRHKESLKFLDALQSVSQECVGDITFTENQIKFIAAISNANSTVISVLRYMPFQKFINRVEKYAGVKFNDKTCTGAINSLSSVTGTYIDYLNMREELGYDMTNTVYLFPKDIKAAHDKMVKEQTEKEDDEHIRKMMETYPNIQHSYRKLRKEYFYEDDEYIIRPARTAKEIILEGRILHHCVGSSNYLSGHNTQTNIILFLRFKKSKDTPYITVEVQESTKKLKQWYGAQDKKPDEEHINKWLDDYIETLKKNQPIEKALE